MRDFKVGDRVQYNTAGGPDAYHRFTGLVGTVLHCSHDFLYVTVLWDNGIRQDHGPQYLLPQADPMPPVPDSVQYREDVSHVNSQGALTIKPSEQEGQLLLSLCAIQLDTGKYAHAGMRLDANDALDLAHDLTRMALKIKREQEKDDA